MTRTEQFSQNRFMIQAFDRARFCPVLQAVFVVQDLDILRSILGGDATDDPEIEDEYIIDDGILKYVNIAFDVGFSTSGLNAVDVEISIFRCGRRSIETVPYLVHTGYELPLMLEGRKKLAKMYHEYPPMTFPGEDRFDASVRDGVLHKDVTIEPFARPLKGFEGVRTAYFTPKGEEWRIPAMKLIWNAAGKAGGWNESFERLEGMLFGYEDEQNEWWIEKGTAAGQFAGMALCCVVNAPEFAWIEASGFRALPPIAKPTVSIMMISDTRDIETNVDLLREPDSVALVRFNVFGRFFRDIVEISAKDPWLFPSRLIPDLNACLLRPVVVLKKF